MVIYDGEKICVQLTRGKDWKKVLELAKEVGEFEYLQSIGVMCLPPTKKVARTLYELDYTFDESAKIFLQHPSKNILQTSTASFGDVDLGIPEQLYAFQKEGVKTLLTTKKNYLLADDMGLGKTCQVCTYLALNKDSLPAVVISPASLKLNWARELKKWGNINSYVISGRNPEYLSEEFLEKYPVWIINYDVLGTENEEEKKEEQRRKKFCEENGEKYKKRLPSVEGWCDEIIRHKFKTIIADEVQFIADEETIRARGVKKICTIPDSRKIFLSGTPYETRTSQFFTCLNILNPKIFPNKWAFLMRYCGAKKTFFGWQFNGLSNAEELHSKISTFMIRRLKKDVLTELPPKQRIVIPMDVSASDRKIYDDMDKKMEQALENKETNALSTLAHLKQSSFESKKHAIVQWIKEYLLLQHNKLVVFVYHKDAFDFLMETFKGKCVGVNGGTKNELRQDYVDKFQKDEKINLFIGQIIACGAGITLTSAKAVAFVEFGQTVVQHEQAEDRINRIGQTADSITAYYLILENSVDEDVMSNLEKHNKDLKKVLNNEDDAELFSSDNELDLSKAVLETYKNRKKLVKKS